MPDFRMYKSTFVKTLTVLFITCGVVSGCGGGGAVTPPKKPTGTQVPTSNENIGIEVGFSPLGISVRQRLDASAPSFTLGAENGQRATPTVDLTGFGQTMDLILEDEPFTLAVYPGDKNISAFGETYCVMVVEPETEVEEPCQEMPDPLPAPVTLRFKFDPAKIPTGFTAQDATIFLFDGTKWWDMGASINPAAGTAEIRTSQMGLTKLVFRRPDANITVTLESVMLEIASTTLMEGDTMALRAYARYSNNTQREVTGETLFTVSDLSRAVLVDASIKGIAEGQVHVAATYQGKGHDRIVNILDLTAPAAVSVLSASSLPSGSEVFVTWQGVPDSDVSLYEVFGSNQSFTDIFAPGVQKVGQTTGALAHQLTLTGQADGELFLAVVAVDDSGNKNTTPGAVAQITVRDTTPPPAVTPTISLDPQGQGVLLDWTAYNSADAKKFTVRRANQAFANVNDAAVVGDNLSGKTFLDTSATAPGVYHYAVVAIDAAGNQLTDLPAEALVSITIP